MKDEVTIIPLPGGFRIETLGVHRVAGGYIHFCSPSGEIVARFLAHEFEEKPAETMSKFQTALSDCIEETCCENSCGAPAFKIADELYIVGSWDGSSITLTQQSPAEHGTECDDEQELLHYSMNEWKIDAEEVIGAFLRATHNVLKYGIDCRKWK